MIMLKHPSLVLHSHDVPGYKYKMHISWNLSKGASAHEVVNRILDAQDYAGDLANVVINAHGAPGKIWAGGTSRRPIRRGHMDIFEKLRNKITSTIWIVACEVGNGTKGGELCRRMAMAAKCHVVASAVNQYVEVASCPYGSIDLYEVSAFHWRPTGQVSVCGTSGAGVPGIKR